MGLLWLPDGHDPDSYIREFGREAWLKLADESLGAAEQIFNVSGPMGQGRQKSGICTSRQKSHRTHASLFKSMLINELGGRGLPQSNCSTPIPKPKAPRLITPLSR